MATKTEGITVTGVEVRDFRRIKLAQVKLVPGVGLVRVTGRNGAGKTSFLASIRAAIGGAGEVHESSRREGAESEAAEVELHLSNDFTVRRRLTEANPKGYLTVIGPDGGKHAQSKLDEWVGPTSFDPMAFFQLPAKRQREILLSLGEDPKLPGKLDEVRAERDQTFKARTPWISQRQRASRTPKPGGERPEPVDVSAAMAKLGELQAAERERGDAARAVMDAERKVQDSLNEYDEADAEVGRLEQELEKARERATSWARQLNKDEDAVVVAEKARDALPDPSDEMEAVKARIEEADAVHEKLEPWREYERAQGEAKEAKAEEDALTAQIRKLDERETELIRSAGIPVPNLSFGEDGTPLLNGRPLELASGAERSILAVSVALAVNPDLRVCLLDEDANGLDLESLEALDALAKEHGFQVWAVRLGLEGPGEVQVVDGEAWDAASRPAEVAV